MFLQRLTIVEEVIFMVRRISTLLALGLVVLWIAGLGSPTSTSWLTWLDGLAALAAFGIAALTPTYARRSARMGEPVALSVGLFALFVIGLATGATLWQAWWTFAFACAFLILGFSARERKQIPEMASRSQLEIEHEREKMRRSA